MGSHKAEIVKKQTSIENHHRDLYTLYAELGFAVAPLEQITPLGIAVDAFAEFERIDKRYEEARENHERIKGYISQVEDSSRKIEQIEADIKALKAPLKQLYSRLGAIAYESFCSGSLPDSLQECCTPLFAEHRTAVARLQQLLEESRAGTGPLSRLQCSILKTRLQRYRKAMVPILIQAGKQLAALEPGLHGIGKEDLVAELAQYKQKEGALQEELAIHRSSVAKLRTQESQSPKSQLESSRQHFKAMEEERIQVSSMYGKALYENLESSLHLSSHARTLMKQIGLHLHRIERLERDITDLQNLMKVEEIEAQIELENQKIEHLHTQIEQSKKQIAQVRHSITRKREEIASLIPEGMGDRHE